MSGKIEISRELLARTYWELDAGTPSIATLAELQAILAAPVVERQPVACHHEWTDDGGFTLICTKCGKEENHEPYGWVQTRGDAINDFTQECDVVQWWEDNGFEYEAMFSHAEQPAPVAADIAHDRAYRNGLMAGFQFGISGNEKGYAVAIANFNSEIHAAKGKVPAPVSVVLPTREDFELWRDRRNAAIAGEGGSSSWYVTQAHYATWEAYGDKVKELNQ